jgi:hypothetical protein
MIDLAARELALRTKKKNERDFNKGCATEPTVNFAGIELAVN